MLGHVLYSWGSWAGVEEHHITAFGHFEARTMHGMVNVDCFFCIFLVALFCTMGYQEPQSWNMYH